MLFFIKREKKTIKNCTFLNIDSPPHYIRYFCPPFAYMKMESGKYRFQMNFSLKWRGENRRGYFFKRTQFTVLTNVLAWFFYLIISLSCLVVKTYWVNFFYIWNYVQYAILFWISIQMHQQGQKENRRKCDEQCDEQKRQFQHWISPTKILYWLKGERNINILT